MGACDLAGGRGSAGIADILSVLPGGYLEVDDLGSRAVRERSPSGPRHEPEDEYE